MIITNCPNCLSISITTAGVCPYCGWSQFNKSIVSTDVLLDDYKRLLFENRNLNARIAELESARRWIPVSRENLPKIGERVFVSMENWWVTIACWYPTLGSLESVWKNDCGQEIHNVTHWMPLPKFPEVQE